MVLDRKYKKERSRKDKGEEGDEEGEESGEAEEEEEEVEREEEDGAEEGEEPEGEISKSSPFCSGSFPAKKKGSTVSETGNDSAAIEDNH